jgi:zinc protease
MTNDRPVGGVSIRLRFDVGSYEEPEADRGVAHFLEHMAFNGTRNIPEGELARRFAHAGVAFGRDQNASTSMFGTTYDLDLPRSDPEALDLAFNWLRDIGDGLLLTPEAVAREQGVILAEHNTRLGPAKDWSDAYQAFAAPNARSRSRLPIGTPETIRTLDAAALSRFHRTWYRPDNAVLIVVGDLPLNALEARVRRTFADWQAPAEPLVRIEATLFDQERPLAVFAYPETTLVTGITACRLSPWKTLGPDTRERRRTFALRSLWIGALNRRLQLLSQGADAPFASASVANSPWVRESDALCVNVSPPVAGDWRAAFSAALIEIRRLEAHGLEAGEISRIVKAQQRSNTTGVRQAGDRYSSVLAQGLLGLFPLQRFRPRRLHPAA